MTKNKHILSLLTILIFSLFAIASTESEDEIEDEISDIEPDITVNATVLSAEYQENEIAADEKYKGKILLVSGTIDDMVKILWIQFMSPFLTVKNFHFQAYNVFSLIANFCAAKLKKGQTITIKGKCDGLMGNVLLNGCTVQ